MERVTMLALVMPDAIAQLVDETTALTGSAPPAMLDDDAPVLAPSELSGVNTDGLYLVGLIGGKDVGKSSLVNALVGQNISQPSSHGRGTQQVIAYAHESQVKPLSELLEREAPDNHRIITHAEERLARQVLLDLPDIDSHWQAHVQLTRRMLRHMLFPIWIQSVEKYADQQPQKLLAQVAEGNDPRNFIFCLNKMDQVLAREGAPAVEELRADFAARIARTLGIGQPMVHVISATHPEALDLPELRQRLSREKSGQAVAESRDRAVKRRGRSLLAWLDEQHLSERADRLARLDEQAAELTTSRIAVPLIEEAIPRLIADPAHRQAIAHDAMNLRIARWPIVNWLHGLLSPLLSVAAPATPVDTMLDRDLHAAGGQSVRSMAQSTFAHLHQSQPVIGELYAGRKLWEEAVSSSAEMELRSALAGALERQRAEAVARIAGRSGILAPVVRWLMTIGALLWFPLVQPMLRAYLEGGITDWAIQVVMLLSAPALLTSAGFLVIYFIAIWLAVRWNTSRRVGKLLKRWRTPGGGEPHLNLTSQALAWIDELLNPIRDAREKHESLLRRADELRQAVNN